ncbi:L-histidine N(alpha)-methyltransferase [Derxia lacustris]|uniref:L-histidine N(alpha)-methyltransferase n=1 Tax=Derxia lacustris TaxID=764842 RepID=UPI000A17192D|nr:L-histidine N(alpha)-methyltransferase [Derxia lacustris]
MQPTVLAQRAIAPLMPPPRRPAERLIQLGAIDDAALADELQAGLEARPARVSPKFLYDELGSRLFDAITLLDEYYPTRTEAAIFASQRAAIARAVGAGCTLIDLGAGDCRKAESLFAALAPQQYVALDISVDYLAGAVERLAREWPRIDVLGIGLDFSADFALPADVCGARRLFFYPGSSIGNFAPDAAVALLARLRDQAGADGQLLLGVDLLKPVAELEAAYDDALGVTAAFNRNLLRNANRRLGADFRAADWRHLARWNPTQACIDMYLEARYDIEVVWRGRSHFFPLGSRIHTESSHKYCPAELRRLLRGAGWQLDHLWLDADERFALAHARVA